MKVQNNAERYAYRVVWSEEDREYVGLCAEMPSLSWLEKSQEAALRGIVRAATASSRSPFHPGCTASSRSRPPKSRSP